MKERLKSLVADKSLLFYLLLVALVVALLGLTNCCFAMGYRSNLISPTGMLHFAFIHLGDAVVLLLPYWLLPPRLRKWMWTVPVVLTVWCFAQVVYNITYQEIMPYSSFLFTSNVSKVLIDSVIGLIQATALFTVFFTAVAWVVYRRWLRRAVEQGVPLRPRHKCAVVAASLLLAVVAQLATTYRIYYNDGTYTDFAEAVDELYTRIGGRYKGYFLNHGFVAYTAYCAATAYEPPMSEEDKTTIARYISNELPHYTDNTFSAGKPNLILIIVESLNSWAIDLRIDGREVTPVLNSLVHDPSSIVALDMQGQVKNGRSSDGKFIYDTGLLPLLDKAVVMHYCDGPYPSLARALRGHKAIEICMDAPGLWNIEGTNKSYGFDQLYYQRQFKEKLVACGYRADELLLDEAAAIIKDCREPFFAQIVTASMHSPYDSPDVDPTWISQSKQYTPQVRNYLERTAYFDHHLGIFLNRLHEAGLMDSTVVVIASDHTELVDDDQRGRPSLSPRGNECALIITGTGHGMFIDRTIGQIDVYPTLLDLMGANQYGWKGLGHSLLRNQVESAAVYPGEIAGNASSPLVKHQKRAWEMSDLIIKKRWFTLSPIN